MTNLDVAHHEAEKRFSQLERQLRVNEERWGAVIANPFMGITVLDKNQYFIRRMRPFKPWSATPKMNSKSSRLSTSLLKVIVKSTEFCSENCSRASANILRWSNACDAKTVR